jgi:hypothetical protein
MKGSEAWRIDRRGCLSLVLVEGCLVGVNFLELLHRELLRNPLLGTWVNKTVHTFATHLSQLVATKITHLEDVLSVYGCYLFGARERMRLLGRSPNPKNTEADLLDTCTTEVRSKNSQMAKSFRQ